MSRLDDIQKRGYGIDIDTRLADLAYLLRVARAAERMVKSWDELVHMSRGYQAAHREAGDAEDELRRALEEK